MNDRGVLIVSADDFGLTPGVCEGVLRAAAEGIVTSTSVLTVAPAFSGYAAALRDSDIGVGLHVALVGEDPPLLSSSEVPSLVDRQGRLPISWRMMVRRLVLGRVDPADVSREASAQLEAACSAGLTISHLDSHQHLHVWPSMIGVFADLARTAGISAIRQPRRHDASLLGAAFDRLSDHAARRFESEGLVSPGAVLGMKHSGLLTTGVLVALIEELRSESRGTAELITHPGLDPDPDRARYRWGYQWAQEFSALCSDEVRGALDRSGWRLGTYADLDSTSL